ncbi:VOC family protein [Spirosoma linguale]|uniref:Glyoxalase/bleomycin resistance protein/dioxygenase n=1 Tax=Spirosoma linguale (strain ATCC 33905 / DSM 74 / LMG 10896 / Claus 1) TaxID=504472 RepID=D2QMY7_SPILD|nr:Glyoxalase/bleomycin resistance protein/dioxygenase [Spirosoma linguale DSM 74]
MSRQMTIIHKCVSITLFAVLSTLSSYAQSNFSSKVIGIGVVVADLDRSVDFYVNGIGMVKTGSFTINEDFGKRSGLTNGVATNVTMLKLENSPDATDWKLMSFGKKASHPKPKYIQDDTGMQYITLQVKALQPIIDRLTKMKVSFLGSTPTPLNDKAHFVFVQDPDGNFIELIGPLQ